MQVVGYLATNLAADHFDKIYTLIVVAVCQLSCSFSSSYMYNFARQVVGYLKTNLAVYYFRRMFYLLQQLL